MASYSLDDDGLLPSLLPILQDDQVELTTDQLNSLVNTRCDPDVQSHNLLSVIVSDRIPHKINVSSSSSSSSSTTTSSTSSSNSPTSSAATFAATSQNILGWVGANATIFSMVEWAAFLSTYLRSDDPDATFEPSISDVQTSDFLPYLRRINAEYNAYRNAMTRQTERHGKGVDATAVRAAFRATSMNGSQHSTKSSEMEELVLLTRPKAKDMMEAEKHLELTLATVPRMFFESEYDFTHPDTFLAVTEMPGIVQSIVRESLPIKLSSYLDMVELSLCKQVSVRAGAFYRAQASLRDSHGRVKVVASKIKELRSNLVGIKSKNVIKPLHLLRLQRRVNNLKKVKQVMELVVEVQATKEVIVGMLNVSEFHSALDVVENTRLIVNTKLIRIRGLESYRRQLEEYEDLIVRTMASRLEVAAVGYHPDDPLGEKNLNAQLKPLVSGLLRTHKLEYVLMEQKKRMQAEIMNVGKTVVRTYLSTSYDDGGGGAAGDGGTRGTSNKSNNSNKRRSNDGRDIGTSDDEDDTRHDGDTQDDQDWKTASTTLKELNSVQFVSFLELLFEHFLIVIMQSTTVHKFLMTALDLSVVRKEEETQEEEDIPMEEEKAAKAAKAEKEEGEEGEEGGKGGHRTTTTATDGASAMEARRPSLKGVTSTTVITQKEQLDLQGSSLEVVTATCTKAEKSIAGVLSKRKEKHTSMSILQMKQLWDTCIRFATKCEKKCGDRMVKKLRFYRWILWLLFDTIV